VEIENRFWSKVERDDENPDKCWEVVALYKDKDGYGRFWVDGKNIFAHRFAFQNYHNRLIQDNMVICHTCDNPNCCNPNHLWEGTVKDNITDRDNKGRHYKGKGEKSTYSILTEKQVLEIRAKYQNNGKSYRELSKEYGISITTICFIIKRKRWSHI
jgi:hypothetical protein